jgi:exopolysaccharide biosynthesis polyprenyl glycosylphosphotransferase
MADTQTYSRTQNMLLTLLLLGDAVFGFAGLSIGYWLRFETPLRAVGVEAGATTTYINYLPLISLGAGFFIAAFTYLNLYDARFLLRPSRGYGVIFRAVFFWFIAFLGTSLVLKFEPPISRLFVAISCLTTLGVMVGWRALFHAWLSRSRIRASLTQRVVLVGWTQEAAAVADAILRDRNHPYEIVGIVTTPSAEIPAREKRYPVLGHVEQFENVLASQRIDVVVVADLDLEKERLMTVAALTEQYYATFKVIPSFFQIFVSNLRLQTISGVPILGVEELPILSLANHYLKRAVDIVGALVGLVLSAPIIAVLAFFIRRESAGPVFYRQVRVGLHGKWFRMYKLRSMKTDAEVDTGALWAVQDDPRRTKIGAFMRETNLDELPQFWNVLIGEMSLVGPRPERPELIAKFEREIPHYNPRHEVRPGMTGWAQVNGLRGNTDLAERIKYDLFYIENWSLWFDVQIMLLTFLRRHNAY